MKSANWLWMSAGVGGAIWLMVGILWLGNVVVLGPVEYLLLLAPLVVVPLGLALVEIPHDRYVRPLYQMIKVAQPVCAILTVSAFLLPGGILAGMLAAGWLATTGLIALLGLLRFGSTKFTNGGEVAINAGFVYLSVGGGWLVLSRLGANPLGFGDLIVLLTAVHFHFAGFAAPVIVGVTGRHLPIASKAGQRLYQLGMVGVIAGMPLVATGITFSPLLELIGAIVMATSLVIIACLVGVNIKKISHRLARILLTVAAISLIIGMLFTYAYAVGQFTGHHWVLIPQMVITHGVLNALGFVLCSLLAWNMWQNVEGQN